MNAHSSPTSWSGQQSDAIKAVTDWFKARRGPQVFRLFGYAGSGKTTLAKEIADYVGPKTQFGAFTGKAAQVLRQKGCSNASTLHSLIYKPKDLGDGTLSFRKRSPAEFTDIPLFIIDECSMVDEKLGHDLTSIGVPILVLGDPAQLPPIKGAGYFTDADPDFMLTEIHRQAAENPIIRLSMKIRENERLDYGDYGNVRVISRDEVTQSAVTASDQILCGLNRTRQRYNARLRDIAGREGILPEIGDRLVCLRNDHNLHIFNGSIWEVTRLKRLSDEVQEITVKSEDTGASVKCNVLDACWDDTVAQLPFHERRGNQEFTYGYALTVHKSQGSQWNDVFLFDESFIFKEDRQRHLYTAVTRAAERLTVVK